jgi:hypothetical protein
MMSSVSSSSCCCYKEGPSTSGHVVAGSNNEVK